MQSAGRNVEEQRDGEGRGGSGITGVPAVGPPHRPANKSGAKKKRRGRSRGRNGRKQQKRHRAGRSLSHTRAPYIIHCSSRRELHLLGGGGWKVVVEGEFLRLKYKLLFVSFVFFYCSEKNYNLTALLDRIYSDQYLPPLCHPGKMVCKHARNAPARTHTGRVLGSPLTASPPTSALGSRPVQLPSAD